MDTLAPDDGGGEAAAIGDACDGGSGDVDGAIGDGESGDDEEVTRASALSRKRIGTKLVDWRKLQRWWQSNENCRFNYLIKHFLGRVSGVT